MSSSRRTRQRQQTDCSVCVCLLNDRNAVDQSAVLTNGWLNQDDICAPGVTYDIDNKLDDRIRVSRNANDAGPTSPRVSMTRIVLTLPQRSSSLQLMDVLSEVQEQKRRRLSRKQSPGRRSLTVEGHEVPVPKVVLDDHPEYSCPICLDVLTHPIRYDTMMHVGMGLGLHYRGAAVLLTTCRYVFVAFFLWCVCSA